MFAGFTFVSIVINSTYLMKLEPTRVKHLSGAPLKGRLLASPTNIRLGWISLPRTNTLAYYKNP